MASGTPSKRAAKSAPVEAGAAVVPSPPRRQLTRTPRGRAAIVKAEDEDEKSSASAAALASTLASFAYNTRASPRKKRPASPEGEEDVPSPSKKSRTRTASGSTTPSPRKAKPIQMELNVPHPAPKHWEEVYQLIKGMRERLVAAVDTMGCERPLDVNRDLKSRRLTILISLMLSSQTKDETTSQAVTNLQQALGGSITLAGLLAASDSTIEEAICKVGFWRRKTQYIRQSMMKLRDDFDSDVPKTVDELCSLPGVGPKMAFLALQAAWDINVGIGVDTHVHRITNRLGWHKPPTTTPEQTRLNLQSWLPKELHGHINSMLVGFGQALCFPIAPRCDLCELSTRKLCPSAQKVGNIKGRREVVWKDEQGARTKIEIELKEEFGGRTEVKVGVPGEGEVAVDVKEEEEERALQALPGEVLDAVQNGEGAQKTGGALKDALDW